MFISLVVTHAGLIQVEAVASKFTQRARTAMRVSNELDPNAVVVSRAINLKVEGGY